MSLAVNDAHEPMSYSSVTRMKDCRLAPPNCRERSSDIARRVHSRAAKEALIVEALTEPNLVDKRASSDACIHPIVDESVEMELVM